MRSRTAAWALALMGLAGAPAARGGEWMPPQVEQGAVEQLAGRLEAAGLGAGDSGRRLAGARAVIGGLRATLEAWGEQGVLERAPRFEGLGVPEAEDRDLDAMGRYHVCNMVLALQLQQPEFAQDDEARVAAIFGLSAITLAAIYLRQPFHAAGGDDAGIEAHLAGAAMEPVFERLQSDEVALRGAQAQCQPILIALLEKPIESLGALASPAE